MCFSSLPLGPLPSSALRSRFVKRFCVFLRLAMGPTSVPEVMNDVIDAMPIVRAIRALQVSGDRLARVLLLLLSLYGAISLLTPVSSRLSRAIVAGHHFKPASMIEWLLLQPAPKMYGFAHRAWIGPFELYAAGRSRSTAHRTFTQRHFFVNHYPARRARFDGFREARFGDPRQRAYLYLRSSYRGMSESTAYEIHADSGKLYIQPIEGFE
jgi:hypothetical protein